MTHRGDDLFCLENIHPVVAAFGLEWCRVRAAPSEISRRIREPAGSAAYWLLFDDLARIGASVPSTVGLVFADPPYAKTK
jgi:hypothetical protein